MAMSDNFPLIPIPGRDGLWHIYAAAPVVAVMLSPI